MRTHKLITDTLKDTLIAQKLLLKQFQANSRLIPRNWSIDEQRAYIAGIEYALHVIKVINTKKLQKD